MSMSMGSRRSLLEIQKIKQPNVTLKQDQQKLVESMAKGRSISKFNQMKQIMNGIGKDIFKSKNKAKKHIINPIQITDQRQRRQKDYPPNQPSSQADPNQSKLNQKTEHAEVDGDMRIANPENKDENQQIQKNNDANYSKKTSNNDNYESSSPNISPMLSNLSDIISKLNDLQIEHPNKCLTTQINIDPAVVHAATPSNNLTEKNHHHCQLTAEKEKSKGIGVDRGACEDTEQTETNVKQLRTSSEFRVKPEIVLRDDMIDDLSLNVLCFQNHEQFQKEQHESQGQESRDILLNQATEEQPAPESAESIPSKQLDISQIGNTQQQDQDKDKNCVKIQKDKDQQIDYDTNSSGHLKDLKQTILLHPSTSEPRQGPGFDYVQNKEDLLEISKSQFFNLRQSQQIKELNLLDKDEPIVSMIQEMSDSDKQQKPQKQKVGLNQANAQQPEKFVINREQTDDQKEDCSPESPNKLIKITSERVTSSPNQGITFTKQLPKHQSQFVFKKNDDDLAILKQVMDIQDSKSRQQESIIMNRSSFQDTITFQGSTRKSNSVNIMKNMKKIKKQNMQSRKFSENGSNLKDGDTIRDPILDSEDSPSPFEQIKEVTSVHLTSESENFETVHEAMVCEDTNKFQFFKNINKKRAKNPTRRFMNIIELCKLEQAVDIMISDEENEAANQSLDNKMEQLIISLHLKERIISYANKVCNQNGCCTRICIFMRNRVKKLPAAIQSLNNTESKKKGTMHSRRDELFDLEYERLLSRGIIKQDHPMRKKWDIIIIVFSLYNCIEIPLEIAFEWRKKHDLFNITERLNTVIDIMFLVDIIMNFRTTFFNSRTGEEIIDKHKIVRNYVFGSFAIDLLSTIPFDLVYQIFMVSETDDDQAQNLQIMSMMKIIRILRLSRLITYLNSAEDIKLSLRLFQTIFLILLYIHITGCLWQLIVKQYSSNWEPGQGLSEPYLSYNLAQRFFISIYQSIMALCGNDIYPASLLQYFCAALLLLFGAILQATMFGQVAGIVQSLSRKSQAFQQKIDLANTSMKNMQLNEVMQLRVRDFMTKTQSAMDNQKELEEFLKILSPSMKVRVTNYIFEKAILKNDIFCDKMEVVDYIIDFIQPQLFFPEDPIIKMGTAGKLIYFLANGDCQVSVQTSMKQIKLVNELHQGDYFGEISIIFGAVRSANVESINYCTLAHLSSEYFHKMCNLSPEIFNSLKKRALEEYDDDWIRFKCTLLDQIHYFQNVVAEDEQMNFYKEIQFYMEELVFQPASEIMQVGDSCNNIMFIVNGLVSIDVVDSDHNKYQLDVLKQGDLIGQFSVLSGEELEFSVTAKTHVRVLTLSENFFGHFSHEQECGDQYINGFAEAIDKAQGYVDEFGVPFCDYKTFDMSKYACDDDSCKSMNNIKNSFQRAVHRAIVMIKMSKKKQNLALIKAMQQLEEVSQLQRELEYLKSVRRQNSLPILQLQKQIDQTLQTHMAANNERCTNLEKVQPNLQDTSIDQIKSRVTQTTISTNIINRINEQVTKITDANSKKSIISRRNSTHVDILKKNKQFQRKQQLKNGIEPPKSTPFMNLPNIAKNESNNRRGTLATSSLIRDSNKLLKPRRVSILQNSFINQQNKKKSNAAFSNGKKNSIEQKNAKKSQKPVVLLNLNKQKAQTYSVSTPTDTKIEPGLKRSSSFKKSKIQNRAQKKYLKSEVARQRTLISQMQSKQNRQNKILSQLHMTLQNSDNFFSPLQGSINRPTLSSSGHKKQSALLNDYHSEQLLSLMKKAINMLVQQNDASPKQQFVEQQAFKTDNQTMSEFFTPLLQNDSQDKQELQEKESKANKMVRICSQHSSICSSAGPTPERLKSIARTLATPEIHEEVQDDDQKQFEQQWKQALLLNSGSPATRPKDKSSSCPSCEEESQGADKN